MTACPTGFITPGLAGNGHACGESLFHVGKGVAFRQYKAPLPGNIIAIARTDAQQHPIA